MIISAQEHLSNLGATLERAFKFIIEHIEQPELIHQVCKSTGITTALLTEIVHYGLPEATPNQVKGYFTRAGLDYLALDLPDFEALKSALPLQNGSAAADTLVGSSNSDYIDGGSGSDTIQGNEGHDILLGNTGDDQINGGQGADYIDGGSGADILKAGSSTRWLNGGYLYDQSPNIIHGGEGTDTLYGGYGEDWLYGENGDDRIYGVEDHTQNHSDGNDYINGGAGNDSLYGSDGDDQIRGEDGNDTLSGAYGRDTLDGGPGNDSFDAGAGDTVIGGSGDDEINFQNSSWPGDTTVYRAQITPGEGADRIRLYELSERSLVTVDLSESQASADAISGLIFTSKPQVPLAELSNFDIKSDTIDIRSFTLFGSTSSISQAGFITTNSNINYSQFLSSPSQTYLPVKSGSNRTPDDYGKGFFVVQNAAAANGDASTIAAFLDPYGNNASYASSKSHYFFVNIGSNDCGLYLFSDDSGANNQIVTDEITPIVTLTGIRTENFSATDIVKVFV